jgi:hypothetical protein
MDIVQSISITVRHEHTIIRWRKREKRAEGVVTKQYIYMKLLIVFFSIPPLISTHIDPFCQRSNKLKIRIIYMIILILYLN